MPRKPSLKKLYEKHLLAILAADAAYTEAFVKRFSPGYDDEAKLSELFGSIEAARKELIERLTKPLDNTPANRPKSSARTFQAKTYPIYGAYLKCTVIRKKEI